jgi:accessory colonization factor AcfC
VSLGILTASSISIRLTYFAFLKKESKLFRKSKKDTYKSQKDVEGLAHLQIWTNSELDHENVRKEQINLAILRASDLYLVKGEFRQDKQGRKFINWVNHSHEPVQVSQRSATSRGQEVKYD